MGTFIASFIIIGLAVAAMAIGVIVSNRRIQGSCGGLGAVGIERACDCPLPCAKKRAAMKKAGEMV